MDLKILCYRSHSNSSSSESKTADDIRQTSDQEDIDEEIEDDEDDWHFDMYDQDGNFTKRVQVQNTYDFFTKQMPC